MISIHQYNLFWMAHMQHGKAKKDVRIISCALIVTMFIGFSATCRGTNITAINETRNALTMCPKGFYYSGTGLPCAKCAIGKYNSMKGSQSENACSLCPAGKLSPENASSVKMCCGPGTYTDVRTNICIKCPHSWLCLGGTSCRGNHDGFACSRCKNRYYSAGSNSCKECPDSTIGLWIAGIVVFGSVVYSISKILEEQFPDEDVEDKKTTIEKRAKKNNNEGENVERNRERGEFQEGIENNSITSSLDEADTIKHGNLRFMRIGFLMGPMSVLIKHSMMISFMLPSIPLINFPPALRDTLQVLLSSLTLDFTGFVASLECEWKVSNITKYVIKTTSPLAFFFGGAIILGMVNRCYIGNKTEKMRDENHLRLKNIKNKFIGVCSYIIITNLAVTTSHSTLAAFDCTETNGTKRMDLDPTKDCYALEYMIPSGVMLYFLLFSFVSILYYSRYQIPKWEDPHACPYFKKLSYERFVKEIEKYEENGEKRQRGIKVSKGFFDKRGNKPCNDCEVCDERRTLGWIFNKYDKSCYNYEFFVIFQKLVIACIGLFFTNRLDISLPLMITAYTIFILITGYYQPYLTDNEFFAVQRLGRIRADIKRKKCSKQGCGINNTLDIMLFSAELCMCISGFMVYNLQQVLGSSTSNNFPPETRNSSTVLISNRTTTVVVDDIGKRVASQHPTLHTIITFFEFCSAIIYFCGFLYFIKFAVSPYLHKEKSTLASREEIQPLERKKDLSSQAWTENPLRK
jgi:hypothetical protein